MDNDVAQMRRVFIRLVLMGEVDKMVDFVKANKSKDFVVDAFKQVLDMPDPDGMVNLNKEALLHRAGIGTCL